MRGTASISRDSTNVHRYSATYEFVQSHLASCRLASFVERVELVELVRRTQPKFRS